MAVVLEAAREKASKKVQEAALVLAFLDGVDRCVVFIDEDEDPLLVVLCEEAGEIPKGPGIEILGPLGVQDLLERRRVPGIESPLLEEVGMIPRPGRFAGET